jgi:hypothetical protein
VELLHTLGFTVYEAAPRPETQGLPFRPFAMIARNL